MASAPVFVGVPKTWQAALSAANTNRDGTGLLVTLVSAGASGSRVDSLAIIASGITTAGAIRFFLNDGTNKYLRKERLVSAITPSTAISVFEDEVNFSNGLVLPSGWSLMAATHNAEAFKVFAQGGDL
ncbi:hypothetical protein LQG66_03780 [Bradyrhizobium ontarionense]|uniref:Uncharacterized protein n=1 Tax=Bradyrhizobium ontarionense TaxID=2898149 RepID=A0ABY3RDI4_9BRAD|nr:hypothetical protein [Bradyrhizobium sp. A19]UFZ05446.1 hypothetical protein LQG66_03780 [Bradyrhizobium sp. A19]